MNYAETYNNDELFDMFANQADFQSLIRQSDRKVSEDLLELAPDMDDALEVAKTIRIRARHLELDAGRPTPYVVGS